MRLDRRGVASEEEVLQLLVNELARVFHDRCLPEDREKQLSVISEGLRIVYKVCHWNLCQKVFKFYKK